MTRWLTEEEQRLWRDFLRMHSELQAVVGRDLQSRSGLSSGDFEVLVHLTDTPEHRLRVTELAHAMRWERSRLSHQLARMEKRGLIARRECPEDARGAFVVLTPEGLDAIESAAPAHVETVRGVLFDALTPRQLTELADICASVLAGLAQPTAAKPGSAEPGRGGPGASPRDGLQPASASGCSGSSTVPGMKGSR